MGKNQCLIFLSVKLAASLLFVCLFMLALGLSNLTKYLKKVMSKQKCSRIVLAEDRLGSLSEPTEAAMLGCESQGDNLNTSQ